MLKTISTSNFNGKGTAENVNAIDTMKPHANLARDKWLLYQTTQIFTTRICHRIWDDCREPTHLFSSSAKIGGKNYGENEKSKAV